jgi:hypothetical protein
MRGGILIQERACPRCTIRRTARLAYGTFFCFNCRLQWPTRAAPAPPPVGTPSPQHVLGPDALARLAMYRAAVRAGFYSDWPVAYEAERPQPLDVIGSHPPSADLGGAV